jgi:hypothetical protein
MERKGPFSCSSQTHVNSLIRHIARRIFNGQTEHKVKFSLVRNELIYLRNTLYCIQEVSGWSTTVLAFYSSDTTLQQNITTNLGRAY